MCLQAFFSPHNDPPINFIWKVYINILKVWHTNKQENSDFIMKTVLSIGGVFHLPNQK